MGLAAGVVYLASACMLAAYGRDVVQPGEGLPLPGDAEARACLGLGPADIARTPAMGLLARLMGIFACTFALAAAVAARRGHRLIAQVLGLGALGVAAVVAAHADLFKACPGGEALWQQAVVPWVAWSCLHGLGLIAVGLGPGVEKAKRA